MPSTSSRLLALAVIAACSSSPDAPALDAPTPDAPMPDAPPPDADGPLACLGASPPATAPDPIAVEGKVFAVVAYQVAAVAGATVELRRPTSGAVITTAVTAADGSFTLSAPSGGAPLDAYFSIATPGRLPTHAYGDPLVGGENALLLVASAAEVAAWYADAGTTHASGLRTVITSVKDCDNASPAGVTLAVTPAPTRVTYYDSVAARWDPTLTAATNGFVLAADTAASLTLTPAIASTTLPPRTITPAADALTLLLTTPRTR